MTVELFKGFAYFFYMGIFILFWVGSVLFLKNKSEAFKRRYIASILFFALILHFLKLLFPPYFGDDTAIRKITPENICALSTLTFPFIFLSKNSTLKDYMFYVGVLSGLLAVIIPIEALEKDAYIFAFDTIRFYVHHIILTVAPFLMVSSGLHQLNYHRLYRVPLLFLTVLGIILINEIILIELGIVQMRNMDLFDVESYRNFSMIFGPREIFPGAVNLLSFFVPTFMTKIPFGPFAGQIKYWPIIWMLIPSYVFVGGLSFLLSIFWERKHMKTDIINITEYIKKNLFLERSNKK